MRQITLLEPGDEQAQVVQARPVHRGQRNAGAGAGAWVEFHEYRRIVHKHLTLVIAIAVVCVGLTLVRDLLKNPTYTASTTLLLRYSPSRVFQNESLNPQQDVTQEPYDDTQNQLLESRSLAREVILEQGLMKIESRSSRPSGSWLPGWNTIRTALSGWFPSLATKRTHQSDDDDPLAERVPPWMVDWYLGALEVKPIENTQLVRIAFRTGDPKLSARIANAHARAYIQRGIELNSQASDEAQRFLAGKLDQLKARVEESELALNNYRRDKGIIPGLISLNGNQDVVVDQLNKLSHELQNAHLQTITLGTQIELIKAGRTDALPQVMDSKVIQGLKAELDKQESQYASMRGEYTDQYPEMRKLREKIEGTRGILNTELRTAVANVNEQYQAALKSEQAIASDLDKQKSFALGLNDAAIKYMMLQREAKTNRELYDAVLKRMKDLTVGGDAHASNVSIVDEAQPPLAPSSPRTKRDLVAATLMGLLLGVCAALFIERLDSTLKTPEEAERHLGVASLTAIPDFSSAVALTSRYAAGYLPRSAPARQPGDEVQGRDLVATYGKYSVLGESFRQLRTALRLSRAGIPPKVIMFTSAVPGEGKTTVTINTASVFAHTGSRVLVIDGDLRRPRCHRVLGMKNLAGLTEALTGHGGSEFVRPTSVENLFLLTCGLIPPNPSELLGSDRMRDFLQELSEEYDYVLIDTSPVMLVSDPLDLCQAVDGVVLVAGGSNTPRNQVAAALGRLEFASAKILGVALNKVRLHRADFPHYYSKSYQGYYQSFDFSDVEEVIDEQTSTRVEPQKRVSDHS
jgi:succinoglycan biosynthesis transport protein ExoP